MMHYILAWLRDFIKNKYLLLLAIAFTVALWILKAVGVFPENQSWYILIVSSLSAINYTMYFLSIKRTSIVKIIYYLAIFLIMILIIFACLDILGIIMLPKDLIKY